MAKLGAHFHIDYGKARSKEQVIFKGEKYRITILSDLLVRLEYDDNGKFEDRPTELALFRDFDIPKFRVEEDERFLVITTKYFSLEYEKNKPFMGPKYAPEGYFKISLLDTDKVWYFGHPEARNFYGVVANLDRTVTYEQELEKLNVENVKKRVVKTVKDIIVKNKGLYSTDGFASIDDSKSMIILEDGSLSREEREKIDTYVFLYKNDFGYCLRDYFKLTGQPALIPRYALGIWWNRDKIYNYQSIKDLMTDFNRNHIPFSVLLLGETWHQKDKANWRRYKTGYTFNPDLFINPRDFITYLHDRGIKIGLNIDPHEGIYPHEPKFAEIAALLNINDKSTIPFNVFDNTILNIYFNKLILPLYNVGVDFFWLDYYNPDDRVTMDALNYYHFNDYKRFTNQRGMILARNSRIAAHRYPVHYSGQTIVSWKTLSTLPYYNSTSSNIGLSWWSHDIGGYKDGIEDSELYVRYVQLGTFSPIFRFAAKYGHYYKREPWKWDVQTLNIVREYCVLRHRLIPYLYGEAYKYHKTGLPLIQPLYYNYPEIYDEPVYKNEYYFGTELFVAPITNKKDNVMGRAVERVFLPEGTWYDFKTGKKFPGNKRYVVFYKDEDYPVFAKSGSIIPLADLEENINNTNSPKAMEIHIFPGKSNIYNLYEDDGYSSLYKDGYYIVTRIDYNYLANNFTVIIRPVEGKSGIIPDKRDYRIRFRNTREADEVVVMLGKDAIPSTSYVEDNDFIVEVKAVPTTQQLTINCKGKNIEIDAVRIINEDLDAIISDLQIETKLKEMISDIIFGDLPIDKKRIEIRKLRKKGLSGIFIRMFIKLLEYTAEL